MAALATIPEQRGTALVFYDAMCRAIDAAYEVDEVKDIRDRASALEHYSRQAHNVEAERQCCEIRLRAERKAGVLLAKTESSPFEDLCIRARRETPLACSVTPGPPPP